MKIKRLWVLGIGTVLAAFLFVACGGGGASTTEATNGASGALRQNVAPSTSTPDETKAPASAPVQTGEDATATTTGYTWVIDTVDDNGAKPSLAVDDNGLHHIAYVLEAMPGFVKHAVPNGGAWDISTVSTGYLYGPLDIQLDQQGVPQISWRSHDEEDAAYGIQVDGEWQIQYIKHPGHDGWDNNIAIDSAGRPHISSIDPVQFGGQSGVEYATFDGDAWTVEEVGSGPITYEFGTFVAVDSQDRPHVVWFDSSEQDLKYAVRDDGSWQVTSIESSLKCHDRGGASWLWRPGW